MPKISPKGGMKGMVLLRKVGQSHRDGACVGLLCGAVLYYIHNLAGYLSAIHKPLLLMIGFSGSLVIALLHDLNQNSIRLSVVRGARTAIVFAVGIIAAHYLRDQYVEIRTVLANAPGALDFFGPEAYSALTNQFVGYGGCFALGLLAARWAISDRIERFLIRAFVLPESMPQTCPHCKQLLH